MKFHQVVGWPHGLIYKNVAKLKFLNDSDPSFTFPGTLGVLTNSLSMKVYSARYASEGQKPSPVLFSHQKPERQVETSNVYTWFLLNR